jgi:hydroxymethylbilane synthase
VRRLDLALGDLDCSELGPEIMLPAPGQGALAIETRSAGATAQAIAKLNNSVVARCVTAERALLGLLGGGCHLPLGCLATEDDHGFRLQAVLGDIDDAATHAKVSRVASLTQDPDTAARVCFEALRLAMPDGAIS